VFRSSRLLLERLEDRAVPDCTTVLSGVHAFDTLTIPAGETWCFDPAATTTVESRGNVVVLGTLIAWSPDPSVTHTLRFTGADEAAFVGGGEHVLDSDVGLWIMGGGAGLLLRRSQARLDAGGRQHRSGGDSGDARRRPRRLADRR
jgi:hypothetical protein